MNDQGDYLVRAIQGPVLLITIGVLFAFDRFTEFHFSQTWPVILIVAGILRLAGRGRTGWQGRNSPPPPPAGQPGPAPWDGPGR